MHLENWFLANKRDFPWRKFPTPYRVWVSEVMLQQTRAGVVVPYFERWMTRFPTIEALASAPLELVIKTWEGLGYYSRARNIHAGANAILRDFGGNIPSTREELLKIPGLGPYTVGAILSFGFQQRAVAVDGNVARVISRYAWIDEEISKSSAKRRVEAFVEGFLDSRQPWITAEALIELGATVCTPTPRCSECPIQQTCVAYAKGQPTALPIKSTGQKIQKLRREIAIVECEGFILVRKNSSGLMADLWEFPYFEETGALRASLRKWFREEAVFVGKLAPVEHSFTRYSARLYPFRFQIPKLATVDGFQWVILEKLKDLPFSSGHRKVLHQM